MIKTHTIYEAFSDQAPATNRHFLHIPINPGDMMTDIIDMAGGTVVAFLLPTMNCTHLRFRSSVDGINEAPIFDDTGTVCDFTMPLPAQPIYVVFREAARAMAEGVRFVRVLFCVAGGGLIAYNGQAATEMVVVLKYTS